MEDEFEIVGIEDTSDGGCIVKMNMSRRFMQLFLQRGFESILRDELQKVEREFNE